MSAEQPPRSLFDRIFSTETALGLAGVACLISGIYSGSAIVIFWGVMIGLGLIALHFVRKKDWQAHWSEMEQEHLRRTAADKRKDETTPPSNP